MGFCVCQRHASRHISTSECSALQPSIRAAFSATTLDTLPTNAGFIAATGLAKAETKQSYKYVGVCTVLNTTIATIVVTLLLTIAPGLA